MRRYIIILWIYSCFATYSLAHVLSFEQHMPLTSDSLLGYKLPYIAITEGGQNSTWDFSNLSLDSAEVVEVNYFAPVIDTTVVGLHREHINYIYHYIHDTLWQTSFETSHMHVQYTSPIPLLRFPFEYGDSLCGMYAGKGQYCHVLPTNIEGTYAIHADSIGHLLLPDMEIDSALRVYYQLDYHETAYTQSHIRDEHYLWFSPSCRYPLLESVSIQVSNQTDTIVFASMYYFPQEGTPQPARKKRDTPIESADSLITDISFMPNPVYTNLQINYSLKRSAKVYISIHYNGGVTTYQTHQQYEEEGAHSVSVNMAGMPIGSYVVYIYADDTVVSGNIVKL